jgi:hypothetical protein
VGANAHPAKSSLCVDCRHVVVVKGARLWDEIVECGMLASAP